MDKIVITGGKPLRGKVKISGAKNASLAILCATILSRGEIVLENIPDISDVRVMIDIIKSMGATVSWESAEALKIVTSEQVNFEAPYHLVKKLRASNLLLGPVLARFGRALVALPGGCNIGLRPMDLHFKGLAGLGAELVMERGFVRGSVDGKLKGTRVYLDFPSVGATENIMMAACLAEGQTLIENSAKEPEIVDLANFLNTIGARVRGAGTDVIKVDGAPSLETDGRYSVIPDRIEAGTFMVAAAATGGDVTLENLIPTHLEPLSAKLREANVDVFEKEDTLRVTAGKKLRPIDIKTMPYPGFPTDMQSQLMAMLSVVPGTSMIVENIFENRFMVANELKRMGARIKIEGRMAVIEGVPALHGAQVKATDLRSGAALIVAGLLAKGDTEISNAVYIDRGYNNLEVKLNSLGAKVWRK
ncbi:UDP-N-acetylglucosamine 1-carboxyvinyltransferase [Pelotomaculum terephthalicicum JT]|uniref:UDP-N-acetylglucosamine 1-carboxyvinyltransferase n=1 Tax=Pelotomaculum terephthalicicum TaxID=206393 RepID=UPI0009D4C97B|nr:UDP-N-acetylglucosamine 1-carboxyvinyltransferase [Pelotomaculum terephthalicicum]MCG9968338.1 UDP-N-acetylglucosamine 1-carboxyvinyltransferase [Pelotomaculum terephthalicicum JT]OPY60788.1 MAG: UDP-N-acetylglucosamine 1-carboxyvinyltransferase 1 [Pelotomaculum sp. PtaU1.Bin065]